MERDDRDKDAAALERVIAKDQQYLDSTALDLHERILSLPSVEEVPVDALRDILKLYRDLRMRLTEVETFRTLLNEKFGKFAARDPASDSLMEDLETSMNILSASLVGGFSSPIADAVKAGSTAETSEGSASERWVRASENSVAFTMNAHLLDTLEYETPAAPSRRLVQKSGRGFTLFTLRGPAASLDALFPSIKLRQHDIIERFSATEIRGVLTHLRQIATADIRHLFERFLTQQYADVKCILTGISSPAQIDEHFLAYLDRMITTMRPGEIRTIDIADC